MRNRMLRMACAAIVSAVPSPRARRLLYKTLLGYEVAPTASLGWCALICVDSAVIGENVQIGRLTRISGPISFEAKRGARIGPDNRIVCAHYMEANPRAKGPHTRSCVLGEGSLITADHYIEVSGGFLLGEQAWIAGRGSQFWSHGAGEVAPIEIRSRAYIGSAVRMAPGSIIGRDSVVAMGAVVADQFQEAGVLIGGVPARIVKEMTSPRALVADAALKKAGAIR